jgi:uncharacterized damage-inducible protein DinB
MRTTLFLVLLSLAASAAVAQNAPSSSNPVSDSVRHMIARQSKNMLGAAEEMPAAKYAYKPTEQQMSFGKLVAHVIEANNFLCARLSNQAEPKQKASEKDGKDKLVAELKSSFDYCDTALKGVQDSQLGEPVTMWNGRQAPKAAALIGLTNDWADHYSQAAMYLRLNGMLPPSAKKKTESAMKE